MRCTMHQADMLFHNKQLPGQEYRLVSRRPDNFTAKRRTASTEHLISAAVSRLVNSKPKWSTASPNTS